MELGFVTWPAYALFSLRVGRRGRQLLLLLVSNTDTIYHTSTSIYFYIVRLSRDHLTKRAHDIFPRTSQFQVIYIYCFGSMSPQLTSLYGINSSNSIYNRHMQGTVERLMTFVPTYFYSTSDDLGIDSIAGRLKKKTSILNNQKANTRKISVYSCDQ